MKVCEFTKSDGSSPFADWLDSLDGSLKYRIQARILRLKDNGHFGFSKRLAANLFELKFKTLGGGIRIYYGMDGKKLVILLCGGNKGMQNRDIRLAEEYWKDYNNRKKTEEVNHG